MRTSVELLLSVKTVGSPKNPAEIHFVIQIWRKLHEFRILFGIRLAASFEESQFVQKFGAVLLHQERSSNAKAEQHDLIEVRNGVSGAFLQQPGQVADLSVGVRRVTSSKIKTLVGVVKVATAQNSLRKFLAKPVQFLD